MILRHIRRGPVQIRRWFSQMDRIRNIGIVAHVDAGKTTVTERLLLLTGAIKTAGDVDSGNTVTDFLDIERERGITVQSAAVHLDWKDHRINLIDTPGHVDFRMEVERCVRVLDGIVCVIDASAGVQPQTMTVWKQAQKFELPAVVFVNKMDKKEANFAMAVESIQDRLGVTPIPTCLPMMEGLVDVLGRTVLKNDQWNKVDDGLLADARTEMLYRIADVDEILMDKFMEANGEEGRIADDDVMAAIRRVTLENKAVVVMAGSAAKWPGSCSSILDACVNFLPSPNDAKSGKVFRNVFDKDHLAGLVFKVVHDKRKGQLSYARVYTGSVKSGTSVFNTSQMCGDGPVKVFEPYADELKPVEEVKEGNIAVLSGLQTTITGDTVLSSEEVGRMAAKKLKDDQQWISRRGDSVTLVGIDSPAAVYFCCIEPPSMKQTHAFNKALEEMAREDPSMKIRLDRDTGQRIIETQGELHLEAIRHRFEKGYKLDVFIGELQVAYKELLQERVSHTCSIEDALNEKRVESVSIGLLLEESDKEFRRVEVSLDDPQARIRNDWLKALNEGCANALQNGPVASYPVHGIRIVVKDLVASGGRINPALVSACAQKCVAEALEKAEMILAEPVMNVEVTVGNNVSTQSINAELMKRRARIHRSERIDDMTVRIDAELPLAEMANLSKVVRTLTSGFGDVSVEMSGYQQVPDHERNAIAMKRIGNQY